MILMPLTNMLTVNLQDCNKTMKKFYLEKALPTLL